jgi:DNA-directed RNA polymerase specialized sigma24 family protein
VTATVAPLTRIDKEGQLYARPAQVEGEISHFLERPLSDLEDSITKTSPSSACLVYFARRFRSNGRSKLWDKVLVTLLARIDQQAYSHVRDFPAHLADEVVERVRMSFLARLQKNHDSLDIFECKFNFAVKRLTVAERRPVKRRVDGEVAIEDLAGAEETDSGYDALAAIRYRAGAQALPKAEAAAQLRQVLSKLTDRERQAVIAVYQLGLPEKSKDPDKPTAAKLLGISDRMVRYLLVSARRKADEGEHSS